MVNVSVMVITEACCFATIQHKVVVVLKRERLVDLTYLSKLEFEKGKREKGNRSMSQKGNLHS